MATCYASPAGILPAVPRARTTKFYMLVLLLPVLLLSTRARAQDQIVKQDKTIIQATVLEITDDAVKYKLFDFPDGPIYNIRKADTFLIIYKNGRSESFAAPAPARPAEAAAPPAPAPPAEPAPTAQPATPAGTARASQPKKDNRVIIGLGGYEQRSDFESTASGLAIKFGAEYLGTKTLADGTTVQRSSGLGVGANYLMDMYAEVGNESVSYSKYYLSLYYFKEFDVKSLALGLLVGPGANYTTGSYRPSSSGSEVDASFFTGGLHAGQYMQAYLGKNAEQQKSFLLRFGFDQFIMAAGSINSTMSLSLGF